MSSMEFIIEGDVAVKVTVTEVDGNLVFDLHVIQEGEEGYTGQIGELNGIFFDMAGDVGEYVTLTAETADGTSLDMDVDEESVSNLGGGINMNGEVIKEDGKYDVGVVLDETGLGNGDTQSISFTLDADTDLTLADVSLQDFGLRLTSVGEPDGDRSGSLKLGGEAPEEPEDPVDVNTANDDSLIVGEDAIFGDMFDFLDNGSDNVLTDDITDSDGTVSPYAGQVTSVNGVAVDADPIVVPGDNGGLLMIYPDGTVDFSANGEFEHLNDFEEAYTSFTYEIEGGSTATLDVTILGTTGIGGEGGGGGLGDPGDDGLGDDGLGDGFLL